MPREVDFATIHKKRGDLDYLGNIADSIGALAARDGDSLGAKSSRVRELAAPALRGFGEFKPRIATGVYGNGLYAV